MVLHLLGLFAHQATHEYLQLPSTSQPPQQAQEAAAEAGKAAAEAQVEAGAVQWNNNTNMVSMDPNRRLQLF